MYGIIGKANIYYLISNSMFKIQNHRELKSFFVLLFCSLLLLLFDHLQVLQPVKAFSEKLFLPPKKLIFKEYQEIKEVPEGQGETKELKEKIKALEKEIAQLATRNSQLAIENQAAQRLLGTPLPTEWQFIPAQTAGLVDGILTIDKGQVDGVRVSQAVLVEDIYVGKVERVGKYQSWVKLPIAKESKLLAKVILDGKSTNAEALNPDVASGRGSTEVKAKGLLVGYGDKMRLKRVLQEEQLAEGDLVITGEFPPNLVIGKIKKVIKKDVEIYQEAEVEPILNYQKLEVVFLLR